MIVEILLVASAVVGAAVSVAGLQTWRKQLRGRAEYDLARRLALAAVSLRESLRAVRNPFITSGEERAARKAAEREPSEDLPLDRHEADSILVYQARWSPVVEALSRLDIESLEAEVLFGEHVREATKPLFRLANELKLAILFYFRNRRNPDDEPMPPEELKKYGALVYARLGDDAFSDSLNQAVDALKGLLKPHLALRR